jgi:hypothetical protein
MYIQPPVNLAASECIAQEEPDYDEIIGPPRIPQLGGGDY